MSNILHTVVQQLVLLGDTSVSMDTPTNPRFNAPVFDLNQAVEALHSDLCEIKHAEVEVMHIGFADHPDVLQDFTSVQNSAPPTYQTGGTRTDYSAAIGRAMVELQERRDTLRGSGLEVNQPWLVFITSGLLPSVALEGLLRWRLLLVRPRRRRRPWCGGGFRRGRRALPTCPWHSWRRRSLGPCGGRSRWVLLRHCGVC